MPYGIFENIKCDIGDHPEFTPQAHQKALLDYFLNKLPHKGLVAFHRLGSGKSCSSILISDEMLNQKKTKKVFVMTPGSLRQNFIDEYCSKCGYTPKYLRKYYTFITMNYSVGDRLPDLDESLVIIDEVHTLINGVKNQSKHATKIYNKLMNSDCKILALTGTPVFNAIWEWPFLGNLLHPGTFTNMIRYGELDKEAFMTKFIIDKNGNVKPKNSKLFKIQLRGIISYFPGVAGGFYPEVIHEPPIQVQMTPLQDIAYWKVSMWENLIRQKGPPKKSLSQTYHESMEEYIMASKYIMSRFMSNFYYPDKFRSATDPATRDEIHYVAKVKKYLYKPTGEITKTKKELVTYLYNLKLQQAKVNRAKFTKKNEKELSAKIMRSVERNVKRNMTEEYELENIGWIDKKQFINQSLTDIYSRKMVAVITNVVAHWNSKHVLFTFFKTKAGVYMLHSLFKMCGIRTEIYSGDLSDGKRKKILDEFNAEKNRYGDKIKMLLVTEAGAQGINILEAQHLHILESSNREMLVQQAIGRVVRYKSHMVDGRKPMPKNEQVVHIWRYWSVSTNDVITIKKNYTDQYGISRTKETIISDKTTADEILYKKGLVDVNSLQSFLGYLKRASVTPYDKTQDKNNTLKDWGVMKISPELMDAFNLSNERYKQSIAEFEDMMGGDLDFETLVDDVAEATDEGSESDDVSKNKKNKNDKKEEKEKRK